MSGFSVRESSRARRLSIKIYPRGRVEVVVPKRTRSRDVRIRLTRRSTGADVATTVFVKNARYDKMMEAFGGVGVHATTPDERRIRPVL